MERALIALLGALGMASFQANAETLFRSGFEDTAGLSWPVAVEVTDLPSGTQITVDLEMEEQIAIAENGIYSFDTTIPNGQRLRVGIIEQTPPGDCRIADRPTLPIYAPVNLSVTCQPAGNWDEMAWDVGLWAENGDS